MSLRLRLRPNDPAAHSRTQSNISKGLHHMRRRFFKIFTAMTLGAIAFTNAHAAPAAPHIGDIVMGEGKTKTVTVILSLSCVFCRVLDNQLFPEKAADLVKRGYAIEIIPVSVLPVDATATAVMRCGPASRYLDRMKRIYASFSMISRMKPENAQAWFIARETDFGFKKGAMAKCFSSERLAHSEAMTKRARERYGFEGTPTIYVNDIEKGHTIADLP
ncbi:MAG: hypothetical protein CL949_20555 [Erythrobacter sp.]|mgnify:CR=1 FL=1|nr:hypothetical protein [Erythrobacter sp.]